VVLYIYRYKGVDFMATTNLNVRVDENLKKTVDTLLNELGLNMSTAINIYLKQIVRENGIPFEIKLDKPNAETLQAMQDVREGKNLHGPFNSLSELMEDLNADD
jgi:addiction module antitoxin, relB/dinJ family